MKRFLSFLLVLTLLVCLLPEVQVKADNYEIAELFFSGTNGQVSSGYGVGSHTYTKAIDICGVDWLYAPFTGTVIRVEHTISDWGNTIWFASDNPVITVDGQPHYVTMMMTHMYDSDYDAIGMAKGKHIAKGELLYREGWKGNANGVHIHLECVLDNLTGKLGCRQCAELLLCKLQRLRRPCSLPRHHLSVLLLYYPGGRRLRVYTRKILHDPMRSHL